MWPKILFKKTKKLSFPSYFLVPKLAKKNSKTSYNPVIVDQT